MKPVLRLVENGEWQEQIGGGQRSFHGSDTRPPIPPEMENRPDAAELRTFMLNFSKIECAEDRQLVLDAVRRAAESEA